MIKAIIFDFFGVLVLQGADSFSQAFYPDDQTKKSRHKKLQDEHRTGHIDYDEFIDGLARLGGTDRDTVLKFTERYTANIELLDYISKELKPKYKLGIISNAGSDAVGRLLGKEYGGLFEDVLLSYTVRLVKPDLEIYEMSAKNLGVKPEECVFTDDITTYCEGAERAGMTSIWYRDFHQFKSKLQKILAAVADN